MAPRSPHTGPGMTHRSVSSPTGAYGAAVGTGGVGSDAESHFGVSVALPMLNLGVTSCHHHGPVGQRDAGGCGDVWGGIRGHPPVPALGGILRRDLAPLATAIPVASRRPGSDPAASPARRPPASPICQRCGAMPDPSPTPPPPGADKVRVSDVLRPRNGSQPGAGGSWWGLSGDSAPAPWGHPLPEHRKASCQIKKKPHNPGREVAPATAPAKKPDSRSWQWPMLIIPASPWLLLRPRIRAGPNPLPSPSGAEPQDSDGHDRVIPPILGHPPGRGGCQGGAGAASWLFARAGWCRALYPGFQS